MREAQAAHPPPVERGRFPKVTIHDNVRLQHRLVTERLGVERLPRTWLLRTLGLVLTIAGSKLLFT